MIYDLQDIILMLIRSFSILEVLVSVSNFLQLSKVITNKQQCNKPVGTQPTNTELDSSFQTLRHLLACYGRYSPAIIRLLLLSSSAEEEEEHSWVRMADGNRINQPIIDSTSCLLSRDSNGISKLALIQLIL